MVLHAHFICARNCSIENESTGFPIFASVGHDRPAPHDFSILPSLETTPSDSGNPSLCSMTAFAQMPSTCQCPIEVTRPVVPQQFFDSTGTPEDPGLEGFHPVGVLPSLKGTASQPPLGTRSTRSIRSRGDRTDQGVTKLRL